jgi:paraquat-inducible protein B
MNAPDTTSESSAADDSFPIAEVRQASTMISLIRHSRMWWVTLVCLVIAISLAWMSMPRSGPKITIRFPDGHGLKVGDRMRHRGIDVGEVTGLELSADLSTIDTQVTLQPAAASLAREGSRFWIVRPQFSLEGITGLETAVGAKYIGVSPGEPNNARQSMFEGLAAAPPDDLKHDGVEIVLRGDERHGLTAGVPVTWRGVDVGQVLAVGLSPDAMHVDVHIRIDAAYKRLVNTHSKFWVTSGLGVDFRLTGVKLTAESLATIARGGVSFITPQLEAPASDVVAGRVFKLHPDINDDWMENVAAIALIDIELPPTVSISGIRKSSLLGIPRNKAFTNSGIILKSNQGSHLLTAADTFEEIEDNTLQSVTLHQPGVESEFTWNDVSLEALTVATNETARLSLSELPSPSGSIASVATRVPTVPEECVVGRSVAGEDGPSSVMYAIGAERFTEKDGLWSFTDDETDLADWHGAPVIAVSDGKLIGLLLVTPTGPAVAPMNFETE